MCFIYKKDEFSTFDSEKDRLLFLRQKKYLMNFIIKDLKKIEYLNDKIDYNNLRYKYKSGKETNCSLIQRIFFK